MKADIPRPLRIPGWVPKPVAEVARQLSRTGMAPVERPLLVASEADFQRLLRALATNPRMRWVWRELDKHKSHGDGYLHPARSPREPVADPQGLAMVVLFGQALKIMRDMSFDQIDQIYPVKRKDLLAAREQLLKAAEFLRMLMSLFLEPSADQVDREEARKLEAAAELLEQMAAGGDRSAAAVKRRVHDNAVIHHVTGELVKTCRIIFRSPMYGSVATIAGVLLGDSHIPVSTIRTWHPRK
jgi:hypothetical protein